MLVKLSKRLAVTCGCVLAIAAGALAPGWNVLSHFPALRAANSDFLVQPYLQLGRLADPARPQLVWADMGEDGDWQVEVLLVRWQPAPLTQTTVSISNMPRFQMFFAQLPKLPGDAAVAYRVRHAGRVVFNSTVLPIKHVDNHYRVDVAGDLASGDRDELLVAQAMYAAKPDLVVVPGDIVYPYGRSLEYLDHFFPVYNADRQTSAGVPMLRHTLFVASPGNHDTAYGAHHDTRDFNLFPDALGYFIWWHLPLDGPDVGAMKGEAPQPYGPAQSLADFRNAAADSYPRQENYSFNFLNSHWTVLDANPYMDWSDQRLRAWLADDLGSAPPGFWKFVVYHQTAFNSDPAHYNDQQMRIIADLLQKYKVNIVFAGHVHNYQRTFPLNFYPAPATAGSSRRKDGVIDGKFELQKDFDGQTQTRAGAPIYITTGGGGASLYGKGISDQPQLWQPFTCKFIIKHSFTHLDISGNHLHVKQISEAGLTLDEFSIDKPI